MKVIAAILLAIIASCVMPVAGMAAEPPPKIAEAVDRAFRPLLQEHGVPGLAVAVTVDGQQYFFVYGVASKESNAPVTKDTLFEIGSISKTFAATLTGYALAQGKISLDDHPGKYMAPLRGSAIDKASLLHLGTYTAGGLPLQFPGGVTTAGMATYFKQWTPAAPPGTERRYSNPSIGLMGHVTALAMKGRYADLVEGMLLPKLGLSHTHIRVPAARMAAYAWGYNKAGTPTRVTPGVLDAEAYGIKTTAVDMIRYLEANIRPDMLEPVMQRAVAATHVGYFKIGEMVQGLGWEQYPYPVALERLLDGNAGTMAMEAHAATPLAPQPPSGPTLFNKTGSTNGFGAYALFVPQKRLGIVMLANRNFPNPARISAAYAVLEALASDGK
jgi:beta-lactamase class C